MSEADLCQGVYLAHRPALVDYAARILGSREAGEDIVQDAFLRFSSATTRAGSARQALAYIYKIVRNLAFDVLKHRKIEAREQQSDPPFWTVPRDVDTPEQTTLFGDEVRRVSAMMADLPAEARIAVEMHRFGGHTLEEVAKHLDISVATAHRHVRAAMMLIAAGLSDTNS
ncbi:RNA polymerase sigma factor [Pararhizobium sp.]|uniref:RNA polymerase sigma factor n=1 Tax=Pararhizobium sp. TaxID=1977563 RepID=UPI0027259EE2|nr:sigma-70 family RNA polymerase sigma factor [Pararhizobium sp.]MDO9418126.1 sigma-70 family RNA polymerase sigma factor [Pararhizobium sp.]